MVNFNVRAEAQAPWTELYNDVKTWLIAGPAGPSTFDDGNDLISLTWIKEKVGDELKWGIRFNHARVDYTGLIEEVAQVNFISIINLDTLTPSITRTVRLIPGNSWKPTDLRNNKRRIVGSSFFKIVVLFN